MNKPEFKDEYVTRVILESGKCYSVKPAAKKSLKNDYQSVIFALELVKNDLNKMKDLSKGKELSLETTKTKGSIKINEGMIITTAADSFVNMEKFLKFYELTEIQVGDFIDQYMENLKTSNKAQNKSQPRPKRKK